MLYTLLSNLWTSSTAGTKPHSCKCTQLSQPHKTVHKITAEPDTCTSLCTYTHRTASWVPVVSSIERFHCVQDSQLGPNGVLYREVPLYTGQPAGSQWCPLLRGSTVYRTASWVSMVSSIERFHCIQDSQLGPNGVLYREVPLYTGQPAGSQWCPL